MRRVLLIFLSLVLALVGWSAVCADDGFYVIPVVKKSTPVILNAPVPKTGQTISYGARDDGELEKGVAWPTPRFTNNNNGTVTDGLTGLIWLHNANAFEMKTWVKALDAASTLESGSIQGLADGSAKGDWRLPNITELLSLMNYRFSSPALSNAMGTGQWVAGDPFLNVKSDGYWSSTSTAWAPTTEAVVVSMNGPYMHTYSKGFQAYVWCVRGGP
jgi:hypothetical protein